MHSIRKIEIQILEHSSYKDREIKGLWNVDSLYNPIKSERVFINNFLISQTLGQGCAYSTNDNYPRELLKNYLGRDFSQLNVNDVALKVCFLDSLYGKLFPSQKIERLVFEASSLEKMKWRTQIIINEATRLLGSIQNKNVVNVGVVGDILHTFKENGANIIGTDYDSSIVGSSTIYGSEIIDGNKTIETVRNSDLAIITGMTIITETIDSILDCCKKHSVKVIVFAETGASLASYYLKTGVDVYLSEYFPFYFFNGLSVIDVCRG